MWTEKETVPYMVAANPVNYGKRPLFEPLRFSGAYDIAKDSLQAYLRRSYRCSISDYGSYSSSGETIIEVWLGRLILGTE